MPELSSLQKMCIYCASIPQVYKNQTTDSDLHIKFKTTDNLHKGNPPQMTTDNTNKVEEIKITDLVFLGLILAHV